MLSLFFELPLKTCILFTTFIDCERNWIHVQMNRQLVFLLFFSMEFDEKMLGYILRETNYAIVKPILVHPYLIFRVVCITSKRFPFALNSFIRWERSFQNPSKFLKKFMIISKAVEPITSHRQYIEMQITSMQWVGVRQSTLVTVFLSYLVSHPLLSLTLLFNGQPAKVVKKKLSIAFVTYISKFFYMGLQVFTSIKSSFWL